MPHKRNPIISERVAGLARLVRGHAVSALEDIALWGERDITHSSVERVIVPDATTVLDYMIRKLTGVIEGLRVYPEHMAANLERTGGLVFSHRVLLALLAAGLSREEAYRAGAVDGDAGVGRRAVVPGARPRDRRAHERGARRVLRSGARAAARRRDLRAGGPRRAPTPGPDPAVPAARAAVPGA